MPIRTLLAAVLLLAPLGCGNKAEPDTIPTEVTDEQVKTMKEQERIVEEQERREFNKPRPQ